MLRNKSNKTIQTQAKKTLEYYSQHDQNNRDWECEFHMFQQKKKHYRLLDPIKNVRMSRQDKCRNISNTQSFYKSRKPLVPCKVSLQNQQPQQPKKNDKIPLQKNPYLTIAKQNFRPYKTIRNSYSLTKQAEQKQQQQGFDFMQYWIKHRFQEGAINTLVEKLKQKNTNVIKL